MDDVVKWLESEAGEQWSHREHARIKHSKGSFGEIKFDHECSPVPGTACMLPAPVIFSREPSFTSMVTWFGRICLYEPDKIPPNLSSPA